MATRTLDVCLPQSIGCDEVGRAVQLVLLPEHEALATCNGVVPSTVTFFQKVQGKVVTKKEKAWDSCRKAWVINNTYEYCYDYCYTFEWDSAATSPDGLQLTKEHIDHYACLTPTEEVIANSRLVQLANGDIRYKNGICHVDTVRIRSLQGGNLIVTGSDLGNYLSAEAVTTAVLANFNISVGGNSGPNQTVGGGQLLQILGGPGITSVASSPRTITISPRISGQAGNLLQIIAGELYAGAAGSGATDSIQVIETNPSGTLHLRHTAVNGAQTTFFTGFKTVAANDGCGSGNYGVSPSKMVRSVSVNFGELRIDSAPEHHSYGSGVAFTGAIVEDITTNTGVKTHGPTPPLVIPNLSQCRQVNGLVHIALNFQLECYPGGVWRHNGLLEVNGGAPVLMASAQYGIFPGLTGIPANMTFFGALSINPGATLTLRASQQLLILAPSFGGTSRIVAGSIGLGYVGGST